jgi:hypothetical protein
MLTRPEEQHEMSIENYDGTDGTSGGPGQKGSIDTPPNAAVKGRSPRPVEFENVVPWPEPVNGAELLDALVRELRRFVVFSQWVAELFALWIVHTYAFHLREVTTYIGIESPEKECGKSTLLTVLSHFVDRAAVSSNISSSAFFRAIEELQPTLLIDEADTNLRGKDDLAGILNSGYTKRTAFVWRMCYDTPPKGELEDAGRAAVAGSSAGRVARYSCWCPKAIAGIGQLHPTLASRCIVVQMHRKTPAENCERLKRLDASELNRKCARFVADHAAAIGQAEPLIPQGLTNRAADIWEPLFALADLAGGRWPELTRGAALGLTARSHQDSPIGSLLLDICLVFTAARANRIFSRDLVEGLLHRGPRPWAELTRGRELTEVRLAQQLRPYGIKPRTIRICEQVAKGYLEEDFMDTYRRYIPKSEVEALKAEVAKTP